MSGQRLLNGEAIVFTKYFMSVDLNKQGYLEGVIFLLKFLTLNGLHKRIVNYINRPLNNSLSPQPRSLSVAPNMPNERRIVLYGLLALVSCKVLLCSDQWVRRLHTHILLSKVKLLFEILCEGKAPCHLERLLEILHTVLNNSAM